MSNWQKIQALLLETKESLLLIAIAVARISELCAMPQILNTPASDREV